MILVVTDVIISNEQKGDKFIVNSVEEALKVCFETANILTAVVDIEKENKLFIECFDYHPAKVSITIQFDYKEQTSLALSIIEKAKKYHSKLQ